jgi:hypothetical protein
MNIIDKIDQYLNEGKYPVDVMFTSKGGKYTITYINPKTKGLPSWVKKGPVKSMQDLEADFEVYNADGRTEKNGYIVEGKMKDMVADAAEDVNDLIQNGYDDVDAFKETAKKYKLSVKQVKTAYNDWYGSI